MSGFVNYSTAFAHSGAPTLAYLLAARYLELAADRGTLPIPAVLREGLTGRRGGSIAQRLGWRACPLQRPERRVVHHLRHQGSGLTRYGLTYVPTYVLTY